MSEINWLFFLLRESITYWCASQQTRAYKPDLNLTGTKGLSGQNLKNDGLFCYLRESLNAALKLFVTFQASNNYLGLFLTGEHGLSASAYIKPATFGSDFVTTLSASDRKMNKWLVNTSFLLSDDVRNDASLWMCSPMNLDKLQAESK